MASLTGGLTSGVSGGPFSGGVLWTPAASTAYLWFDPSDDTTTTIVSGALNAISSKIGTGVMSSAGVDPGVPVLVNGSDGLMIDNTNKIGYLKSTDAYSIGMCNSATAIAFAFVCKVIEPAASFRNAVSADNPSSSNIILLRGGTDEDAVLSVRSNDGVTLSQTTTPSGSVSAGFFVLSGQIVAGTSQPQEFYINGTLADSGTSTISWDATDLTSLSILGSTSGSNRWNCCMGDIGLWKTTRTSLERDQFDAYLAYKYDLIDLFPDDFQFKNTKPTV